MARRFRARPRLIGKGSAPGALYDLGYYPGATFALEAKGHVIGEVFAIRPGSPLKAALDIYEGAEINAIGSMYSQVEIEVTLDRGGNKDGLVSSLKRVPLSGQAGSEGRTTVTTLEPAPPNRCAARTGRGQGLRRPALIELCPGLLRTKFVGILLSLPEIFLVGLSVTQQQAALSGSFGALVLVWLQEQFHFKEGSHFFWSHRICSPPRNSLDPRRTGNTPCRCTADNWFYLAGAPENATRTHMQTTTAAMKMERDASRWDGWLFTLTYFLGPEHMEQCRGKLRIDQSDELPEKLPSTAAVSLHLNQSARHIYPGSNPPMPEAKP